MSSPSEAFRTAPRHRRRWPIPPWMTRALLVPPIALVPWTLWLVATLPSRHLVRHWDAAWVGFDVGLILALAATAVLARRRSAYVQIAATVAATMLIADAWFDVFTSRPGPGLTSALVEAGVAELPLAAVCLWVAFRSARVTVR